MLLVIAVNTDGLSHWKIKTVKQLKKHLKAYWNQIVTKVSIASSLENSINEAKSVTADRFIRTLENRICRHTTAIRKNAYNDELGYSTYHGNGTQPDSHLVFKLILNHLEQLAKWLSCVMRTYLYGIINCAYYWLRVAYCGPSLPIKSFFFYK